MADEMDTTLGVQAIEQKDSAGELLLNIRVIIT